MVSCRSCVDCEQVALKRVGCCSNVATLFAFLPTHVHQNPKCTIGPTWPRRDLCP